MSPITGPSRRDARRQAGFSLVAAIFLIVVLAALGTFAVQVAMTQQQGANLELLEARAQAAAAAGIEYGANMALQRPSPVCTASKTLRLTQGALAGFVVTVTCAATAPHQIYSGTPPTATSYTVYALGATATSGGYGRPDYVARTVTRNVTHAPP
jgi:MSHA biogenesis protein MshP